MSVMSVFMSVVVMVTLLEGVFVVCRSGDVFFPALPQSTCLSLSYHPVHSHTHTHIYTTQAIGHAITTRFPCRRWWDGKLAGKCVVVCVKGGEASHMCFHGRKR